jgi:kynurenine formamidase
MGSEKEKPVSSSSSRITPEVANAVAAIRGLSVLDVSPDIEPGMPMWFLYEGPDISPTLVRETHGAVANRIALSEHTGSHVDAPFHFDPDGLTIAQVAADALFLRPYKKYVLADDDPQPGDLIGLERLKAAEARGAFQLCRGDVAVMEMGWDRYFPNGGDEREDGWWGRNQPGLSPEACEYLADVGVTAVASDTAACDVAAKDGEIVAGHGHSQYFLPRGILIVEGLRHLADVPTSGLMVALPLKINGGTGSPIRVLLLG